MPQRCKQTKAGLDSAMGKLSTGKKITYAKDELAKNKIFMSTTMAILT